MAEREPWEDELVDGLVEAGNKNFSAADSEEAMENIADPIAKAIKQGGSSGQQQSDWSETDPSKVTFIKNKPNLPSDIPSRQEMAAAIGVETTRATTVEASLQAQINGKASQEALAEETAAREAADTQLQSNIDAEIARAEAAESALGTRLTTAEGDIDTLESGLSAETEARESADNTLQTNIDNEATARENADNALDARLDEAESDIDSLESSVDALYNTEVEGTTNETSVSSSTSGKVKTFVVGLASAIKTKIEAAYSHISDAVKHITATERSEWGTAYTHSQTSGNPHGTTIEEIDGLRTELTTIESDVSAIEGVIPSEATPSNQLADKSFVNSSVTTNTATFRGTSAKNLTEAQFLAWANSLTKTKNDYCFWDTTDSDGNVVFKRYKWNDVQWQYEYTLNNSSFTAAQWAAIQSGITADDVADIGYNTTARHSHSNKNLLDTYTQTNANIADAVTKKHTHENKDVLDNTTASYTSEEKTKLAGIESGAEVNVNSDWNATSGDAQILNKPSTFPPSSHTHSIADVTGLQTALNGKLDKTGKAETAGTADRATADASGNTITSTYATKSEIPDVSGYETSAHAEATYATNSAVSDGFTNVGNAITQEANSRVEGDSSVYNQLSQSIQNEAQTREETDQSLGTAIQNLGNVKANADGSNASGTWGISISGKSERTDRVVGYSGGNSAANIYGFKIATITSNSTTNTCGFEAIASLKQGSNAGMLLMLIYAYMRGSTIRLSGRVINTSGWTSSLTPITLSAKTVDNGFDIYIEHPAFSYSQICVSPLGGRSSGATITYHSNQQLSSKLTGQASSYNLLKECSSTLFSAVGSTTRPVYVNEYGQLQPCGVFFV